MLTCRKLKLCTEIDEGVYVAALGVIMQYQALLGDIRHNCAILGDIRRHWGPGYIISYMSIVRIKLTEKRNGRKIHTVLTI